MPAEERPREAPDLEGAPEEHYFDDLARGLASGTLSRRRAFELTGTAILGGALGFLSLPRQAEADDPPTGKGIGTRTTTGGGARRRRIRYRGGPVMLGTVNIYYIWYGNWDGNTAQQILTDFITNLGGSEYHNINTLYPDSAGAQPTNSVIYGGSIFDAYSRGTALSDADVAGIVANAINTMQVPLDPNGIYFVLASQDVTATSGFCSSYCGFHQHMEVNFTPVKYAFVGNPARCPSQCQPQSISPNDNAGADAMASIIANLVSTTVTDPLLSSWYDRRGLENADKCAWTYGTRYTVANEAKANMRLGNRDYLIQRNWVKKGAGYCALSYP